MNYDLDKFGLSEEELFSPVDNSSLESEKITAPRYSYWHSVFRVFFKKKINIAVLCLLGVILLMTYVYPLFVEYDRFANLMNGSDKTSVSRQSIAAAWIQYSLDFRIRCFRTVDL